MFATPAVTPVTIPVPDTTVAIPVLLLLQLTPVEVVDNVIVLPTHTSVGPVIEAGSGLTVTIVVEVQPVPIDVVIVAVPADCPVTIPVNEPTVATVTSLLLQLPPELVEVSVVVCPTHTVAVPVMAPGPEFIVTIVVA